MPDLFHDYTTAELIDDIETHGRELTDWETHFVDEMAGLLRRKLPINAGARRKLEQIHRERVG